MKKNTWVAKAPSNIALIKYMGRKDEKAKIPDNASLSYTLSHLNSFVELEVSPEKASHWEPLIYSDSLSLTLSIQAQQRFLNHLKFVQNYFDFSGSFIVRSSNNFPQATGLASSASSFAALTQCAVQAICALKNQPEPSITTMAQLSRQGSGSSCRSFFSPFALWDNEHVESVQLPYSHLIHQVIMISRDEKKILSSEAHKQVQTSPFYKERAERAENRLKNLLHALKHQQWKEAYKITWDEFQDMHHLFETSTPSFTYRTNASYVLLDTLQQFWDEHDDGPLITMDAGPNIHLLYRPDQTEIIEKIQKHCLNKYGDELNVLST